MIKKKTRPSSIIYYTNHPNRQIEAGRRAAFYCDRDREEGKKEKREAAITPSPATTMSIFKRPLDAVICVLLCYFIFSCVCIERNYCESGLSAEDTRSDPMLLPYR